MIARTGDSPATEAGSDFARQVETALERLHDLPYLQRHPLAALLRAREPALRDEAAGRALQRVLREAVEALRGAPGTAGPAAGRAHEVLVRRYIEGEDAATAGRALGVHQRTLYRAQAQGLAAVAALLAERWRQPRGGERDRRRTNLPRELTSFVGRERDVEAVKALLARSPLVTLTGAGGVGKTRLALRVAAELLAERPDGAWLVDLGSLQDEELVPQVVLAALDLREAPGQAPLAALVDHLSGLDLLLLLDTCEHLAAAAARLADALLRACPRVTILATSRELLGVAGEASWRVPSLPVPEPTDLPPDREHLAATLTRYDAVRLFVDRAAAAEPTFRVTRQNAAAVAQVCVRLDGIPLALELAAARVRALGVEEIAARLDQRFRLLRGGSRVALPRQQTLEALVAWSYDLLAEPERLLFDRLSAFAGRFTLGAAERVCAGSGSDGDGQSRGGMTVDGADVVDLLVKLVERSLVVAEESRAGHKWYRLLETLRQYGRERLVARGEAEAVRARHAAYYVDLAERAARELMSQDLAIWLARMDGEIDNVRSALRWLIDAGEVEPALRLCGALSDAFYLRGQPGESRRWLTEVLAAPGASAPTVGRGRALLSLATLSWNQLELDLADALADEARAILRACDDTAGVVWSVATRARVAVFRGEYERARALAEEALALRRASGCRLLGEEPFHYLGQALLYLGDYAGAEAAFEASMAEPELADVPLIHAANLDWLGHVATARGDLATARERFARSMERRLVVGRAFGFAFTISGFAGLAATAGDLGRAVRLAGAAARLCELAGVPPRRVEQGTMRDRLPALRAALGAEAYDAARAAGYAMTVDEAVAFALAESAGHGDGADGQT